MTQKNQTEIKTNTTTNVSKPKAETTRNRCNLTANQIMEVRDKSA